MSEDSAGVRSSRASPEETCQWLKQHLRRIYEPALEQVWVLDLDSTVKLLYVQQEKAVEGCTNWPGVARESAFSDIR